MPRVHILEGTDFTGKRFYACGRTASRKSTRPYVGRALLKERGNEVTCRQCRWRCAGALPPEAAPSRGASG